MSVEDALAELDALRAAVDARVGRTAARHVGRLRCGRGCSACCVDSIEVFSVEALAIRERHGELLARGEPGPPGACAFLDAEGACRIYPDRPHVCRTQGLPLRFFLEDEQGEIEERRDICALNLEGPALASIDEDDCWLIGPDELRLAQLEDRVTGGAPRRLALRGLFGDPPRER